MKHLCDSYWIVGTILVWFAAVFMALGLISAAAFAVAEIKTRLKATPAVRPAAAPVSINDLTKALTDLVAALASAPIWLAMFALAVALYWFVGAGIGSVAICQKDTSVASAKSNGTPADPSTGKAVGTSQ